MVHSPPFPIAFLISDAESPGRRRFRRTGKRSEIFLATKFGFVPDVDHAKGAVICGTAEYTEKALERSLERLGVEQIDLWYLHT